MMFRTLVRYGVVVVFGFCVAGAGTLAYAAETIHGFSSAIVVAPNGTLEVTETIRYDFGAEERHGIYRVIPLVNDEGPRLVVDVFGVERPDGTAWAYTVNREGDALRIRIGDPDRFVRGTQTYVIRYAVQNAIRYFDAHDELYWNVTGNDWPATIVAAETTILLPRQLAIENVRTFCYTGPTHSTSTECRVFVREANPSTITFATNQPLVSGDGLTVVVALPVGFLTRVAPVEPPSEFPWAAGLVVLGNVLIFGLVIFVNLRARSSMGKQPLVLPRVLRDRPIVVQYEPPAGLTAVDVGYLMNQALDSVDISAGLVSLATERQLAIRSEEKKIPLWPDRTDYIFTKVGDGTGIAHPIEKAIFEHIFSRDRSETKADEVQWSPTKVLAMNAQIKNYLTEHGYLRPFVWPSWIKKALRARGAQGALGAGILAAWLLGGFAMGVGFIFFLVWAALLSVGASVVIVNQSRLSDKGTEAVGHIAGFRDFLKATQAERLKFHNAPSAKPEQFEKYLPYAIVLGVYDEWAKVFEGMYEKPPEWYHGSSGAAFSPAVFTSGVIAATNSYASGFAVSSGSGGSGGGGSSGGGSGGGGGGSW